MSYRITTDSTSDLPQSFLKERDIPAVGMGFQLDGQEYREDENLTLTMPEFYAALREGKMSSTMQVNTINVEGTAASTSAKITAASASWALGSCAMPSSTKLSGLICRTS